MEDSLPNDPGSARLAADLIVNLNHRLAEVQVITQANVVKLTKSVLLTGTHTENEPYAYTDEGSAINERFKALEKLGANRKHSF